jgi:ATP-binding cassette, subfamily C, bacterial CydD
MTSDRGPALSGTGQADTGQADPARAWLKAAAGPGRTLLRLAAVCQAVETAFTVGQFAALAWIAQDALSRQARPGWPELSILSAAGLLAATAAWAAARCRAAGGRRIGGAIRRRLVAGLLPSGQRPATGRPGRHPEPAAAAAAQAIVEQADDVAGYHAQALPLRASAPASMAIVFAATAAVQWPSAVILLAGTLIVPLNMRLAGLFAAEGAAEQVTASTQLGAVVLESFRGMRTLQGIGALARRRDELADAAAGLNTATMAVTRRAFISGAVMDVVITFAIAVDATYIGLSLLGYVRLHGTPPMTLFGGLFALLLCPMYFAPLRAMAAAYHDREKAVAAVPAIMALLGAAEAVPGTPELAARRPAGPVTVVLDDATVRFPDTGEPALRRVNLTARPGRWTAISGASGAGKTTVLSLISGIRQPASGTVRWVTPAGVIPPQLGDCAWIGQRTVILPGSVSDNIRIGRPAASQAEVEVAVAAAGLADVVARLPQGLGTALGEGGWGISAGEARRIAIARAFLADAELWVLDEPTAHLDPATEAQVIDALQDATQGRTVIVATHSAAVARCADALFTVADGTVQAVREASLV